MVGLQLLFMATLAALGTATKEAAFFLVPRVVWCKMSAKGFIASVSMEPGGRDLPHGATMAVADAPLAYYYLEPTPMLQAACRLGAHPMAFLLATGRKATAGGGEWREFRRCSLEEFEAAYASWMRRLGG